MYNMSTMDGIARIFLTGIWGAIFGAMGGYVAFIGVFAVYFLVTGLGGYCPIYKMMGISTASDPEINSHDTHGHGKEVHMTSNSMKSAA